jgi:hypothetical protein
MGGLGAGAGMAVTGLMSGGISGFTAVIGAQVGAATAAGASMAAMGAAVGAVALPVLGVAAAVLSFFKKKKTLIDSGISATIDMENAMFQTFQTIQTKRFWGLSKKTRTSFSTMDSETSEPLIALVDGIQGGVLAGAEALSVSSDVFDGFAHKMTISLKGLDEAAQQEAVTEAMTEFGNAMASNIDGIDDLRIAADGSYETLQRLVNSLVVVNDVFDDLGFAAYNLTVAGADAASQFIDLFGSMDNFVASTAAYYDAFYTAEEKRANATAALAASLAGIGIDFMPNDRDAYRSLVDTAEQAGDSDLAAALIQLSPAFANLTTSVDALSQTLRDQVEENRFASGVDYRRGLSRAGNGIEYTPEQSSAEMIAELKALNARIDRLQSTSEFTAFYTGQTAENTDEQVNLTLEATG